MFNEKMLSLVSESIASTGFLLLFGSFAAYGLFKLRKSTSTPQRKVLNIRTTNPIQSITEILCEVIENQNLTEIIQNPYSNIQIKSCLKLMNDVALSDLGMSIDDVRSAKENLYMSVFKHPANQFSLNAFILPAGSKLPLHSHPNMVVCAKLVVGSMRVRSFSPSNPQKLQSTGNGTATLDFDSVRSAAYDAWLLSPTVGNIHSIVAITACVMLDIFLPPYSELDGRECVYYFEKTTPPRRNTAKDSVDKSEFQLQAMTQKEEEKEVESLNRMDYNGYKPLLL